MSKSRSWAWVRAGKSIEMVGLAGRRAKLVGCRRSGKTEQAHNMSDRAAKTVGLTQPLVMGEMGDGDKFVMLFFAS